MKEIILKLKVEDLLRKKTSKPSWLFLFREKNETLKIYLTHSSYSCTNKCEISSVDDITDHPMSEAAQAFIQESLKEVKFRNLSSICKFQCYFFLQEDECLDRPMEMDSNPTYKRCHLCVRIFSTKANLRYPLIF